MTKPQMPWVLRAWLFATRVFPYPIKLLSKRLHLRMGADPERFSERLGMPSQNVKDEVIWFHAASLGEVAQIRPLAHRLSVSEHASILVTTTTQAGADWVERELPDAIHQFAPIDTPSAVAAFLNAWKTSIAIFIEGDHWPRLTLETRKHGVPQVLLNARHSRTRDRFSKVFATMLSTFSLVTCRSEPVADGIRALGVPSERVKVLPDLRIATAKLSCSTELKEEMITAIGKRPIWLAASTHPADESAVLSAHKRLLADYPDALLILAPRHPKRAEALITAASQLDFKVARRSKGNAPRSESQIYLVDTLGELGTFFSLAPVVFLGGSFGEEGGHNPYEPASFGTAILSGANVRNFDGAYLELTEAGAAELLEDAEELGERLAELIGSAKIKTMGEAGSTFMESSEESVSVTAQLVSNILRESKEVL